MPSLPIVEDLDVLEERGARRRARRPRGVVDELDLERAEETFGDGVVPAIAPATHAADEPVARQQLPVLPAGVLRRFKGSSQRCRVQHIVVDR